MKIYDMKNKIRMSASYDSHGITEALMQKYGMGDPEIGHAKKEIDMFEMLNDYVSKNGVQLKEGIGSDVYFLHGSLFFIRQTIGDYHSKQKLSIRIFSDEDVGGLAAKLWEFLPPSSTITMPVGRKEQVRKVVDPFAGGESPRKRFQERSKKSGHYSWLRDTGSYQWLKDSADRTMKNDPLAPPVYVGPKMDSHIRVG